MSSLITFYFGEETFLTREAVQKVIHDHPHHQVDYLEGTFDVAQLIQLTQSTGLFASKSLIILKNPFFLFKKCDSKDEKVLEKLFKTHQNEDVSLLIYATQHLDQRKKFVTLLKKQARMQQFNAFKDWEQNKVLQWIQQRLKSKKKSITQDALFALEQLSGGSLEQCNAEINTLLVFVNDKETITIDDINALSGDSKATPYQLTEALKKRQYSTVHTITTILLANQEDPIKLMGLIISSFRLYYMITYLKQKRQNADQMAKVLRKNTYFIKLIAQELTYSLSELKTNLSILAEKDIEIKKGIMKADLALECAINQMALASAQVHQST